MSISRKFDIYNEECVVSFSNEGDERLYMPLCGITHCRPNYHIERRNSCECVVEYIVRGSGVFRTNGLEFHPIAGDVYIAHIGTNHAYRTSAREPWEKIWFNLQGTLVGELVRIYGLENTHYLPQCNQEELFRSCLEEMRSHPEQAHETATLTAHRLFFHLGKHAAGGDHNRTAVEIKRYIDNRLYGPVTIGELAALLGKSPSQVNRIFHQEYGISPYRYFMDKKLELAKIMLEQTSKSVKEISGELNFADACYFSNLFKTRYRVSPRAFRRHRSSASLN